MKKRVLLLAAIVALIAGAGIAYAASSGSGLPGGNAVWGGGHAAPLGERDFSIVATPAGGEFLWGEYGLPSPVVDGDVTCMNVSGNQAVIGGIVRDAYYVPEAVGMPFIWFVTDNGKLAATTPDQVSAGYVLEESDIAAGWAGVTKAFPHVCPPSSAKPDDVSLFDLTSGDIVVQNANRNAQR